MIKKVSQLIADILLRPFKQHFLFFIVLCLLITAAHSMGYFVVKNEMNLNGAIATMMHCVSFSYLATLLVGLAKPTAVKKILQVILLIFAAVDFIGNFYCSFYLHNLFDDDVALLIMETDPKEAKEFLTSMVPLWMILTLTGVFLFLLLFWQIIKRYNLKLNLGKKAALIAMGITCICLAGNMYRWGIWRYGPIAPFVEFSQHENPSDLRDYFSHPRLTFDDDCELPADVVLIIGESFGSSHSSIYGYDKLTNPQLARLKENSLLFSFDSIYSPAPSTVYSLRHMLTTYSISDEDKDKKWYEYISLIEIMKESGYKTCWFGNQGRIGKHNGSTRVYAQACDHQWFLKKDNVEDQFDEVLVDSSYQYISQLNSKDHNFIIYHMKGSHFDYSKRYPSEFSRFTASDYPGDPQTHREVLASYDNSILYNDHVVNSIIDLFKDKESIVIYLSDHGQVMYRNSKDPDYYAHGRKIDPVDYALGTEIPFFIYASPLFQQKYPQVMERIKLRQENPKSWNSDDLLYLIMDLIGIKQMNGEEVRPRSIVG